MIAYEERSDGMYDLVSGWCGCGESGKQNISKSLIHPNSAISVNLSSFNLSIPVIQDLFIQGTHDYSILDTSNPSMIKTYQHAIIKTQECSYNVLDDFAKKLIAGWIFLASGKCHNHRGIMCCLLGWGWHWQTGESCVGWCWLSWGFFGQLRSEVSICLGENGQQRLSCGDEVRYRFKTKALNIIKAF